LKDVRGEEIYKLHSIISQKDLNIHHLENIKSPKYCFLPTYASAKESSATNGK
jgi:hypothetical protein